MQSPQLVSDQVGSNQTRPFDKAAHSLHLSHLRRVRSSETVFVEVPSVSIR